MTEPTKCLSCQYEAEWKATGSFPSESAQRHWSMWGCTCTPESEKAALEHFDMYTR